MCPIVAKCNIFVHGVHSHLQTTITSLFQLQIEHRLKLWTPDFPRFEITYGMHEMDFGKLLKYVQQFLKWGYDFMVCALKDFKAWRFRNHFTAAKRVYRAAKWHLCSKGWFYNCETPFQLACRLRNGGFQGVEVSQPFRSCETGVRACEMELVCQGTSSQLRKFSQRVLGGCETISQRGGRFSQRLTFVAKFRRPCSLLAF